MKNYNKNKQEPQFNSTQEVLKIVATIAATVLVDKIGRVICEITNSSNSAPMLIDTKFDREGR